MKERETKSEALAKKINFFTQNHDIYKSELQDMVDDLERRYTCFYESVQVDITSLTNNQNSFNSSMERFVESVEKRTNLFEEGVQSQIRDITERVMKLTDSPPRNASQVEGLDPIALDDALGSVRYEMEGLEKQVQASESKIDNFRNEVRKLLVELEDEMRTKNERVGNAIAKLSRVVEISNPLI